jgi:diguanylate cyclase (GGDEF)-like protein/PAS domain S-box-containing protein
MTWNSLYCNSLKTRIILTTLAIFLASLWSLSFYVSLMLRKDMEKLLGEQLFSTASMVASQINRELERRLDALETVAELSSPAMQAGTDATQTFLEQRPDLRMLFSGGIFIVQSDGTRTAYTPFASYRFGINLKDRDYIIGPLQEGKPTIGQPIFGRTEHAPVVVMAAPIRDNSGKTIGALAGSTILSISTFMDQITESHYGNTGGYLLLAPKYNIYVTATNKNLIMQPLPTPGIDPMHDRYIQGYEGYGVSVSFRGVEELTAAKSIPVSGWILSIALPTAEAFAPIRNLQQRMLGATLFLTVLAGWMSWWMLKRQLSPLLVTSRRLSTMTDGTQPLAPLPVTKNDEIGQLIGGFNRLLKTLGERETALQESEARFKVLHDASFGGIAIYDQGIILDCNQGLCDMTGHTSDELIGMEIHRLVAPEWRDLLEQKLKGDLDRLYDVEGCRKDGSRYPACLRGKNFVSEGQVTRVIEFRDITERKRAEAKLVESESRLKTLTNAMPDLVWLKDCDGLYLACNHRFERFFGASEKDIVGKTDDDFLDREHADLFREHDKIAMKNGGPSVSEEWGTFADDGHRELLETTHTPMFDSHGRLIGVLGIGHDITSQKEHERQLEHIAHFDVLTTLPNRVLLADRLHQAMAQTLRRGQLLAVAYIDLDGFKSVNDDQGHEIGDQLLVALADRMNQTLREGDTIARLGGDEFVAVLLDLEDADASAPMLDRLLQAAAQPVQIGDLVLQVSASLGVTFFPQEDEVDADQLLRQSDQAMYQAKLAGKNRFHIFDAERDRYVRSHHESLEHIRSALAEGEFVLHYQPKVNMRTGTVIGAEALIRWRHQERGLLLPSEFLPVIEDHPLAVDLGEWVVNSALTQLEIWHAAGLDIPISVNVGARQLQQNDFIDRLREILAAHPTVRPNDLEMEVLETSAMEDLTRVSQIIEAGREIGVGFALDDFGTGYSSLTYLKRLPVALLKIDQSFVHNMLDDPDDLAILEGVLGLANAFRRSVLAEGVETVAHGTMLLQLGCELAQGYGIARPMPAADFPEWAVNWRPDPVWGSLSPVDHDDVPILFACAEHRAWISAIETNLKEGHETPRSDFHQCRFDQWLDAEGLARYGTRLTFQAVAEKHRQVHALAAGINELQAHGKRTEARARLEDLHCQADTMVAQLQEMMSEDS